MDTSIFKPLTDEQRNTVVTVKVKDPNNGESVDMDVKAHTVLGALKKRYDFLDSIKTKLTEE